MIPTPDLLDDGVRVGGPDERLRVPVVLGEVAVDRLLQGHQRVERAPAEAPLVSLAKKVSTALSHEEEVGVKWKVQRGWRSSQASTLGCLWVA
jgi:hypothetical protein